MIFDIVVHNGKTYHAILAIISVAEQEGRAVPELYRRMALKG